MAIPKYKDIFHNRIPEFIERDWLKQSIKERLGENYSNMEYFRWLKNEHLPSVDSLVLIAELSSTNTAFLIGQTDIKNQPASYEINPKNLKDIISKKCDSIASLARDVGTSPRTITKLIEDFPHIRTNSLVALAEALSVSTDYLLGLCEFETWEHYLQTEEAPFIFIKPGEPAFISVDDLSEVKASGNGQYCLMHDNGESILLSNGTVVPISDDRFVGMHIYPVKPEINTDGGTDDA